MKQILDFYTNGEKKVNKPQIESRESFSNENNSQQSAQLIWVYSPFLVSQRCYRWCSLSAMNRQLRTGHISINFKSKQFHFVAKMMVIKSIILNKIWWKAKKNNVSHQWQKYLFAWMKPKNPYIFLKFFSLSFFQFNLSSRKKTL